MYPNYQSKSGTAFTYEEEKKLVNHCIVNLKKNTSHAFLVLLYAGLRRSELASLKIIDGKWLECETSKERMGKNVVKRKIPFTPKLAAWMHAFELEKMREVRPDALTQAFKRLMPAHQLHELRHTFITRCQECGVPREVVSVWAGHAADGTQTSNVYTHFSREFMKDQAQKVAYNI